MKTSPSETAVASFPENFTVTITEEDRQKAEVFCSTGSCLLATAVKRATGAQRVSEYVESAYLYREGDCAYYRHDRFDLPDAHYLGGFKKPHYSPDVVGTQITFTRAI